MLNNEIRKKGRIVEYFPLRKTGSIEVDDSDRILPFTCKHVRSLELRKALCCTDQFGEIDVCLHTSIPVVFTLYGDNLFERAGRIDLENSLSPKTNLAQQSIGYSLSKKVAISGLFWYNRNGDGNAEKGN